FHIQPDPSIPASCTNQSTLDIPDGHRWHSPRKSGSHRTPRWRTESRANPSLKHLPVGVQAIELSTGGMGAIKKIRDQPHAPPPKHGQAAADRCAPQLNEIKPGTPGRAVIACSGGIQPPAAYSSAIPS